MKQKAVINRRIHMEFISPYSVQITNQLFQKTFHFKYPEFDYVINLMNLQKVNTPIRVYPEVYAEVSWDTGDPYWDEKNKGKLKPELILFIRANLNSNGAALIGTLCYPLKDTYSVSIPVGG